MIFYIYCIFGSNSVNFEAENESLLQQPKLAAE